MSGNEFVLAQIMVDRFLRGEDSSRFNLNSNEKLIMFFLASYMGNNSACYPSEKLLAEKCSLSLSTIERNIKSLKKKGVIKVKKQNKKNQYSFTKIF